MRYIFIYFILIFTVIGCKKENNIYTAMSYNIRYDNPEDGMNNWHKRKATLVHQIKGQAPDILGIQEGLIHQVSYLNNMFPNYNYVGVGREDGETTGEFAAIFYNTKKWQCLQDNTFWLSETPSVVSIGWDAALERICTYALLENTENKQKVWALNIHFDHQGQESRKQSAKLLLSKIEELQESNNYPIILTGDFNTSPNEEPIQILKKNLEDSFTYADEASKNLSATFNNFDSKNPPQHRIDYIFTKDINVRSYRILVDGNEETPFISDHFPVVIKYSFR